MVLSVAGNKTYDMSSRLCIHIPQAPLTMHNILVPKRNYIEKGYSHRIFSCRPFIATPDTLWAILPPPEMRLSSILTIKAQVPANI